MALDTGGVVALLFGSSVLSAVINQTWTGFRDRMKLARDAGFSALYLAIALEAYASACASLIGDSQNYHASDGHAGKPHGNIADLPAFPDTIDWKAMGLRATTEIQTFRVDVETVRAMFHGLWDFDDEDGIVPRVREEAARLGLQALTLAAAARKAHGIKAVDYAGGWDIRDYLTTTRGEHVANRERYEEQQRRLGEEMMAHVDAAAAGQGDPAPGPTLP